MVRRRARGAVRQAKRMLVEQRHPTSVHRSGRGLRNPAAPSWRPCQPARTAGRSAAGPVGWLLGFAPGGARPAPAGNDHRVDQRPVAGQALLLRRHRCRKPGRQLRCDGLGELCCGGLDHTWLGRGLWLVPGWASSLHSPSWRRRPGSCVTGSAVLRPSGGREPLLHDSWQSAAGLLHLRVLQKSPSVSEQLFVARPPARLPNTYPNPKLEPNLSSPTIISCPLCVRPARQATNPRPAAEDQVGAASDIWPGELRQN